MGFEFNFRFDFDLVPDSSKEFLEIFTIAELTERRFTLNAYMT